MAVPLDLALVSTRLTRRGIRRSPAPSRQRGRPSRMKSSSLQLRRRWSLRVTELDDMCQDREVLAAPQGAHGDAVPRWSSVPSDARQVRPEVRTGVVCRANEPGWVRRVEFRYSAWQERPLMVDHSAPRARADRVAKSKTSSAIREVVRASVRSMPPAEHRSRRRSAPRPRKWRAQFQQQPLRDGLKVVAALDPGGDDRADRPAPSRPDHDHQAGRGTPLVGRGRRMARAASGAARTTASIPAPCSGCGRTGLQPHRVTTFKVSTPIADSIDIVGLYHRPAGTRGRAVVDPQDPMTRAGRNEDSSSVRPRFHRRVIQPRSTRVLPFRVTELRGAEGPAAQVHVSWGRRGATLAARHNTSDARGWPGRAVAHRQESAGSQRQRPGSSDARQPRSPTSPLPPSSTESRRTPAR